MRFFAKFMLYSILKLNKISLFALYIVLISVLGALESGLRLLNPYKLQSANFRHGANFAVAGATALSEQVLEEKKISTSHKSVQLDWMSSHFETTCSTDCTAKLKKALFLVGEIGGNEFNFGLSQGKTMEERRSMVPEVLQTIIQGVRRVIGFGATQIVLPGNFPIGCIPISPTQLRTNDSTATMSTTA
ncbi:acetylajmalan esterase-like [Nicotiana tomentosiformis]|uniref:acetylajmalan esterase-like n=1 Tax=Nicotiana tomentosiformis TaxID=4098 RepID=UPI00388C69D6